MSEADMKASKLGHEAEQAMGVITPAIDGLIAQLTEAMKVIPIGQSEQVLSVHAALVATEKVKSAITSIIANGQLAEAALMQANILNGDAK